MGDAPVAIGYRRVRLGLVRDADDVEEALAAGVQQWVVEGGVLGVDVGTGVEERTERIGGVASGCDHRRGRAVGSASVWISTVRERGADRGDVAGRGGIEQTLVGGTVTCSHADSLAASTGIEGMDALHRRGALGTLQP